MSEEIRPSTTNDTTNISSRLSTSSDPESKITSLLPDDERQSFHERETADISASPSAEMPDRALLTESRFSRSQKQDEDAALASLDKTILRPAALYPHELDNHDQVPRNAEYIPLTPEPTPRNGHVWRRRAAMAMIAAVVVAAIAHIASPRKSNVGIFGITTPVEHATTPSEPERETEPEAELVTQRPEEVTSRDETPSEEPESPGTDPVVEEKRLETKEDGSESSEPTYPDWVYRYNAPRDTTDETSDQQDWSNSVTTDDHSLTYTFDGGNVMYNYDDGTVTLDLDGYDPYTYNVWDYNTPIETQERQPYSGTRGNDDYGYGYGYGPNSYDDYVPRGWGIL